jgi:AraC-like DNA-binding protein
MASAVTAVFVDECEHDTPRVVLPRPEIHLAVRFGPSARNGLDVHVLGGRLRAHRKLIRGGQRNVLARLRLGAHEAVLGAPVSVLAGRIVELEDLWGAGATAQLVDRLAKTRDGFDAAEVLERAIEQRVVLASRRDARVELALDAASRLRSANVNTVAADLGVSERHLRRSFRETVGMSPKEFAKLARFRRALRAAREEPEATWASIAATAGYYDQAHLIAEFRAIAGVTPRALLGELRPHPFAPSGVGGRGEASRAPDANRASPSRSSSEKSCGRTTLASSSKPSSSEPAKPSSNAFRSAQMPAKFG